MSKINSRALAVAFLAALSLAPCLVSCGYANGYQPILCDFQDGRWRKVIGPISSFDIEYEFGKGYKVFDVRIEIPEGEGYREVAVPGECYADAFSSVFALDTSIPESGLPVRIEGRFIAFADCVGSLECDGATRTWTAESRK